MPDCQEIIDIDAEGFSADGEMLTFTNDLAAIAKHMFELVPVMVRNPDGDVTMGNRLTFSPAALSILRREAAIGVNEALRDERQRSGMEVH